MRNLTMSRCALRLLPMMFLASPSISFGGESVPPIRSLFVYPDEVDLVRQDAVQRLVVWGELEDGKFYDLTDHDALRIESSDPAVVKIGRSDEGARPAVRVGCAREAAVARVGVAGRRVLQEARGHALSHLPD